MAISKKEFQDAFRQVVSEEFAGIPTDESSIDIQYSPRFEKKMEKLIRSERKSYWFLINTASKRAAIIIAVFLMLFTVSFGIKAIREPIVKFIKDIYYTFIGYSFEGDVTGEIEQKYTLTYLPEGFELTNELEEDVYITLTFENYSDEFLQFKQSKTEGTSYNLDNENGQVKIEILNGIKVKFYDDGENKIVFWAQDGYFFDITTNSDIDTDTFKQMILSVK